MTSIEHDVALAEAARLDAEPWERGLEYRIARFLPDEGRLRAARAEYTTLDTGSTRLRENIDLCPLAVVFGLDHSPWAAEVAEILAAAGGHDYGRALEAANSFIADVDTGLLGPRSIASALGADGGA